MRIKAITLENGQILELEQHINSKGEKITLYTNGYTRLPLNVKISRNRFDYGYWVTTMRHDLGKALGYNQKEMYLVEQIPKDRNLALLHIKHKKKGIRMLCEEALKK